jgi:lysophospholipase L1-like esterase
MQTSFGRTIKRSKQGLLNGHLFTDKDFPPKAITPFCPVKKTKKVNVIMRKATIATSLVFLVSILTLPCFGEDTKEISEKEYKNPDHFEKAMQQFETADQEQPPPQGAIVGIGSSSMRGWHSTIKTDLAPLTIIPRGFGGSNMNEALHYADRIVLPYKPRAILLYEGDNDIAQDITPKKITDTFRAFIAKVHKDLPNCRIYFLSIKPSISRWKMWPKMQEANNLIAAECAKDKRLTYVDVASGMLDDEGKPLKNIFKEDNLHMTRPGYVIWENAVRPILIEAELQFEQQDEDNK